MSYKIAVLPGDGVGKEVIEAAMIVLDEIALDAEYLYGDIGWEFWRREGNPLPDRTVELLKQTDCALFGAITSKPKEEAQKELAPELQGKGLQYYSPIVKLRQMFDLYANVRPAKAYKGNPLNYREGINITVFRENTEGLYSGVEYYPVPEEIENAFKTHPRYQKFIGVDKAISLRIISRKGAERIIRAAFEFAKENNLKNVTVAEKPNVLRETSGLFVRVAREIHKEYPEIEMWETNIDAQAMWLIKNPEKYDVIVTSNLFGDVLSDLASQLVGGLGFAASGNIGDNYAVFEPVHGSAPKYAGLYKVNPIATIRAVRMMLDYLGEKEKAARLERAIEIVVEEGKVRTYDMGGNASTLDMAREIAKKYAEQ
ncbi:isocitrate/isopropylmalate dehydrogenase [Aciduliprofundum sp. MAR08-339]|uniref:isocitrate/isopropylmalate dehydrogenase family protein n=1 Tax=Aciduliprofundum sp. (strain MAR08-339) TaxID=673860 RepID=UPI0002A49046|nr:isocitrate/isopropylmalate dehydrogenase [Aciduliprofundum sp. MAR08-339]